MSFQERANDRQDIICLPERRDVIGTGDQVGLDTEPGRDFEIRLGERIVLGALIPEARCLQAALYRTHAVARDYRAPGKGRTVARTTTTMSGIRACDMCGQLPGVGEFIAGYAVVSRRSARIVLIVSTAAEAADWSVTLCGDTERCVGL